MSSDSEIASWYAGRSVFITGASGFMGKVLLEKLLYGCPDIKTVYILLRAKRGRTAEQRIEDMWKIPMFERLRKLYPDAIKKVIPVNGDLISDGLGLNEKEREMVTREVSVVFHMAATLKLEGTLKDAIAMNVAGTHRVIELSKQIKNLLAFVHLSTAFCNSDQLIMEEKIYPFRDDPHELMRTAEWMSNEAMIKATPDIIAPHPNTYIYTKRLAELLVNEQFPGLPVAVTRPSIVAPAAVEPLAGWVDNLNGPIGLLVGAAKGVIRTMKCKAEYPCHTVPVDLAINGLIAIGRKTAIQYASKQKPKEIPVYNMSQDGITKVTFGEILDKGRKITLENPFEWAIWYPGGDIHNEFVHKFYIIFLHFLPAYILDFLLLIFGQKRFMVRVQWRISEGLRLLEFFTTNFWNFKCDNFYAIFDEMTPIDKKRFNIDFTLLDHDTYLKVGILGARQYCVKEDLSSLTRCRIKQKFLYVLDKLTIFTIIYFLLSLIGYFFEPVKIMLDASKSFVSNLF